MTKLQKRVYSLILRSLILLLYYKFHDPDGALQQKHGELRQDLNKAVMDLEKGTKIDDET